MIFIGFGYLMTFLKKYSFGAVGYNLFIASIVLQWATLIGGYINNLFGGEESPGKIKVNLKSWVSFSEFAWLSRRQAGQVFTIHSDALVAIHFG